MVWSQFKILFHGENNFAVDSERSKKERKTYGGKIASKNVQERSLEIP